MIRIHSRGTVDGNLKPLNEYLESHPYLWAQALAKRWVDLFRRMVAEQSALEPGHITSGYWIRELEPIGAQVVDAKQGEGDAERGAEEFAVPDAAALNDGSDVLDSSKLKEDDGILDIEPESEPMIVGEPVAMSMEEFGATLVKNFAKRFSTYAADKLIPRALNGAPVNEDPGRRWSSFLNCHTFAQRLIEEVLGCDWPTDDFPHHEALWMDMAIDTMYMQTRFHEVYGTNYAKGCLKK